MACRCTPPVSLQRAAPTLPILTQWANEPEEPLTCQNALLFRGKW